MFKDERSNGNLSGRVKYTVTMCHTMPASIQTVWCKKKEKVCTKFVLIAFEIKITKTTSRREKQTKKA